MPNNTIQKRTFVDCQTIMNSFLWENKIHCIFSIFSHLLNLPQTCINILKQKSSKLAQPFSSFSETQKIQFILIYKIYIGFDGILLIRIKIRTVIYFGNKIDLAEFKNLNNLVQASQRFKWPLWELQQVREVIT